MSSDDELRRVKEQIESMLKNPIEPKYAPYPIRVSGKVVQQISTGIYRSPGNAVKELVNNAFDADAPEVIIKTGLPTFTAFQVYDTGGGMSPNEFVTRMQSIGASMKGAEGSTPSGRPIIGKIGIGLLAAAHISRKFTVISGREKFEQGFEAKIDMSRFFETETETKPLEEISAGSIQLRTYIKPKDEHYTLIQMDETSDTWRKQLGLRWDHSYFNTEPRPGYKAFVLQMQESQDRVSRLSGYDQLLWELGLLCPVAYFEDGPIAGVQNKNIDAIKGRLNSYNFTLTVDDTRVRKPFLFPAPGDELTPIKDYGVYPLTITASSDDAKVSAIGYVYHQAVRIIPPELRGILPRIRNVGIGLPSYNMFRVLTESPVISYQVFGELYVDEGLDTALNIDRSSFFEGDPSFKLLVRQIEEALKESKIIGDIRTRQNERSAARKRVKADYLTAALAKVAAAGGIKSPRIRFLNETSEYPVKIIKKSGFVLFYTKGIRKRNRDLLLGTLLCYELAKGTENPAGTFLDLVRIFFDEV